MIMCDDPLLYDVSQVKKAIPLSWAPFTCCIPYKTTQKSIECC